MLLRNVRGAGIAMCVSKGIILKGMVTKFKLDKRVHFFMSQSGNFLI